MNLVTVLRVSFLFIFLYHSICISWQSVAALVALLVTVFFLRSESGTDDSESKATDSSRTNPLRGKPSESDSTANLELLRKVEHEICQFVTYDAENVESLRNFKVIQDSSECSFAKKAKLWGSPDWKYELSLEENVLRLIPTFYKFTGVCQALGLDGFLVELPGEQFGHDPQTLGKAVCRLLTVLSDNDPAGFHCMDKSYIDKKGWVFEFNRVSHFVTTFSPCYPQTNSRYAFNVTDCYVLFQPEISFAQHNLALDTPETSWENPKTARDRIRVAFKKAGRPYKIRDTIYYPMAHDIVKPCESDGELIEWWSSTEHETRSNYMFSDSMENISQVARDGVDNNNCYSDLDDDSEDSDDSERDDEPQSGQYVINPIDSEDKVSGGGANFIPNGLPKEECPYWNQVKTMDRIREENDVDEEADPMSLIRRKHVRSFHESDSDECEYW